jgi:hypothetical protein
MESAMTRKTSSQAAPTDTAQIEQTNDTVAQAAPIAVKKPEPKPMPTFPIEAGAVTLSQERTRLVPLPETFFFEANPSTVTKPRGHQVDPSRVEGCSPVMPNLTLLETTGNPYPVDADETVVTAEKYKPFVLISHLTYAKLKEAGEFKSSDRNVIAAVLAETGVKEDFDSLACVKDTLRDLALFGVATQYSIGRARLFRI